MRAAPLGVRVAKIEQRVGAYLLDFILVFLTLFIGYLIWWLFTLRYGQTPGKQLLGIRVMRADGLPSGWVWTFLREFGIKFLAINVLSLAIAGLGLILWVVDLLFAFWDKDRQALHDKVMSTVVVDDRDYRRTLRAEYQSGF